MSYPSIKEVVKERGIDTNTASEAELSEALWQALNTDLKDGINYLELVAHEVKQKDRKVRKIEDPKSPLGQQILRLLGTDIARQLVSDKFDVRFALYNCCGVIAAPTEAALDLSVREQIQLQDKSLVALDC
jgi:uncharacterized membrane protein